jgi:hypothetical protein
MYRVFKTRNFARWLKRSELTDAALFKAVQEMVSGLIDADLGGDIVKKRVALPGRGKRAGARTLIATRRSHRWIYVFGFDKNERSNISPSDLEILQTLAEDLLDRTDSEIDESLSDNSLQEIFCGNETQSKK